MNWLDRMWWRRGYIYAVVYCHDVNEGGYYSVADLHQEKRGALRSMRVMIDKADKRRGVEDCEDWKVVRCKVVH